MGRRSGRRGGTAEVVTIYWRDIPAQVNGQQGRDRHQLLLSSKFQRAVDRAKRKAGIVRPVDGMGAIEEIFGRIAAVLASA